MIVLIGRHGSGKGEIAKALKEKYDYQIVPVVTTDQTKCLNTDYEVVDSREFRQRLCENALAFYHLDHGEFYGIAKSAIDGKKQTLILNPEWLSQAYAMLPGAFYVYIRTDMKTAVMHMVAGQKDLKPENLWAITDKACQDFGRFDHYSMDYSMADIIIDNYDNKTADEMADLVIAHLHRLRPNENDGKGPLTFRIYQSVRFNRPVDPDKDCVSPGGYELRMLDEQSNTKQVQFDFMDYEGNVDKDDPCVVHMVQKNPDYSVFGDLCTLTDHMLRNIVSVFEWFIFTGEPEDVNEGETPLIPIKVFDAGFEIIPSGESIEITVPIKPTCNFTEA